MPPTKISEMIRLLEQDGWTLKRVTGSHRHFSHSPETWLGYRGSADADSVTIPDPAAA